MTSPQLRPKEVAYWVTPWLLCLLVHWAGFTAWFRADDFAWLSLWDRVHSFHDLLVELFAPQAQGTIRPWSERAFFMVGFGFFGLNALPYKIVIFATQFADLVLVEAIGTRLTGLRAAGFWAAVLWTINSAVAEPLGWVCVYNEILCGFFLLLAFYFLLRWIETGRTSYNVWQWVVFVLGFGALELNVVYPALAAGYTFLCARKNFLRTLPMFAVSAVYVAVHTWAAPPPHSGVYAMHFDSSMFRTLETLWSWSVASAYLVSPLHLRHWMMLAGVSVLTVAVAWFVWLQVRERHNAVWFCLLWFLVTIGPLLPLRDHMTEYYVYLPVIGLCWLAGWALARYPGVPAFALAALYAFLTVPQTLVASNWNHALTHRVENLVEGLAGVHERHPKQQILLSGVDSELFYHGVRDKPYILIGIPHLYLAPGTEKQIEGNPDGGEEASQYILPGHVITRALQRNELVVYDAKGPRLRNITAVFASLPRDQTLPRFLNAGDPLTADLLGPEWYAAEDNHRWMPKRATLKMGAPATTGRSLYLHAYCTAEVLREGPLSVVVTVDGRTLLPGMVRTEEFELLLPLPDSVAGKPEMQVAVEVSRTYRPPSDSRDLGLAFGALEVR